MAGSYQSNRSPEERLGTLNIQCPIVSAGASPSLGDRDGRGQRVRSTKNVVSSGQGFHMCVQGHVWGRQEVGMF